MKEIVKTVDGIEYTYVSLDERINYICSRCDKKKNSRKYAYFFSNGRKNIICNGCYGTIIADSKLSKT